MTSDPPDSSSLPQPAWARPATEVAAELGVDPTVGLPASEVEERLERFGRNVLRYTAPLHWSRLLIRQFKSLVVVLLLAAGVVAAMFGDVWEAVAVAAVVLVNAGIGFWMEFTATRSMEALRDLGHVMSTVIRGGETLRVEATDLVPGDIVVVEAGDMISADLRVVDGARLQLDESVLTGESVPVSKNNNPVSADAILADRKCMLFKGTSASRGFGACVVVGTGLDTELGRISQLIDSVDERQTPLEKRLDQLAGKLLWVCLGVATLVAIASWYQGRSLVVVVETAIALAIATIPEGLPIVATIALARGMFRMSRRHALVKDLSAVETLGATSVVCTDKTGTLTHNHLTVHTIATLDHTVALTSEGRGQARFERDISGGARRAAVSVLRLGAMCNHAELEHGGVGDPLEVALLEAAVIAGIPVDVLDGIQPIVREETFDPDSRLMATWHPMVDAADSPDADTRQGDAHAGFIVAVKGAPESVVEVCSQIRTDAGLQPWSQAFSDSVEQQNADLAGSGLRVLAVASKTVADTRGAAYEALIFEGLIAMVDPPRQDVKAAIAACKSAGMKVVMLTGDQPLTARHIALQVGLTDDPEAVVVQGGQIHQLASTKAGRRELTETTLFARVSPEEKLDIIDVYQQMGQVVAMTGDGVNDAPALRRADIGIAMGKRGTDVAREAAEMVLQDDAFETIAAAIEQGRVIFRNIRTFVVYLMACNISELLVVSIASLAFPDSPLPITPLQILYLNLVTDVFPALALGLNEGDRTVMQAPPRPAGEPVLRRSDWGTISHFGALMTACVLAAYAYALGSTGLTDQQSITVAFSVLAFAQLFHVFNMRSPGSNPLRNEVTRNRYVWGALLLCTGLVIGPVHLPVVNDILSLEPIPAADWLVVLAFAWVPVAAGVLILWRKRGD